MLDRVVVALDPEQRPDARQQLVAVEALRDEFVRPGFDRLRLLRPVAGREHDHRKHGRLLALAELPADAVAVELRLSQYATPSYVLALLEGGSEGRAYLLKERVKGSRRSTSASRP